MATLHGILIIDKPVGLSSAQVVARVKAALGSDRAGHTGTLDPLASGVLPIALGEGTKLAGFLLADDKEYEGELELGVRTDTLDAEGRILGRAPWSQVTAGALGEAMASLTGTIQQVPPMASALRHEGRRLYELHRKGVEVERAARSVTVRRFELVSFTPPRARFVVACSKGTYVRALVRDVGQSLGCGAMLSALRRTRSGRFGLARALTLDQLAQAPAVLVSPADAVGHLPSVPLDASGVAAVAHGRQLAFPEIWPPDLDAQAQVRLLTPWGALAALARRDGEKLSYLRVFNYSLTSSSS